MGKKPYNKRDFDETKTKEFEEKNYSNGKGKGKRPKGRRDQREGSVGGMYVNKAAGRENDASWYNQIPTLVDNAANISWFNQLGAQPDLNTQLGPRYVEGEDNLVVGLLGFNSLPGIMAFDTVLTPGTTSSAKDPMNIASINLYEYVRKALNKPNPDYEAQDLTIMNYCIMTIYAHYANILRAFGITGNWDMENLYTPLSLMRMAYGWKKDDYDEFISNRANYLSRFNQLIYKASFLFLPTSFKLMDRYAWLFSNIFRDHHRAKGQYYIHSMYGSYYWDESDPSVGSKAKYFSVGETGDAGGRRQTMKNMLDTFDDLIERLRNSSSVRIMQSDMRKAFEDKQAWSLAYADDMYTVPIVDSDEVLMQIENLTYLNKWDAYRDKDIVQNVEENGLIYAPYNPDDASVELYKVVNPAINIHMDNASKDDIMVATRQKLGGVIRSDNHVAPFLPSDFVVKGRVLYAPADTNETPQVSYVNEIINADGPSFDDIRYLGLGQSFDWAPGTILASTGFEPGVGPEVVIEGFTTEWDNYTVIGTDVLNRLHTVALLSMWHIGEFGAWSSL